MFFRKKKPRTKATEITAENFDDLVTNSDVPVLLDFWAAWCGPCKVMGPIMDELEEEYKGQPVHIGKVNMEAHPQLSAKFAVRSIPTFIFFDKGKPVSQGIGLVPKYDLVEVIEQCLPKEEN